MNVIIIANRTSPGLSPLSDNECLAMLPIAGKPLLEHTLEAVARIKPTTVTVVGSRSLASIKRFVGIGAKWGLNLAVLSSRPNEPVNSLRRKQRDLFEGDVLVVECDRLCGFPLQEFLDETPDDAVGWFVADTASGDAGLRRYRQPLSATDTETRQLTLSDMPTVIPMKHYRVYPITTLKEFHEVNLQAAAGDIPNLTSRGRERAIGLTTGFMSKVHPRCLQLGKALVGNHCRVASNCILRGRVVINHGVVVDRGTRIEDSVIMDRTFLGENLHVKNAIVEGNTLIRVDTGAVVNITDRFLVAALGESLYNTHFADITNRLMGVMLCLLSLPLWPVALLVGWMNRPRQPYCRMQYVGNKAAPQVGEVVTFNTIEFSCERAWLRRLPLVLAIASGHIRLVGVSICAPDELGDRTDSWQTIRDSYPSGALGPTQLHLPNASTDEKIMADAIFAQQAATSTSAQVCWQAVRMMLGLRVLPKAEMT